MPENYILYTRESHHGLLISKYYAGVCLEGLSKSKKNSSRRCGRQERYHLMHFAYWFSSLLLRVGKKLNCALVQALRLCTGRTARRGSRGIALPFHDHGTGRGWGVSVTSRPLFAPGKDRVPIVQEAWVGPRAGFDRCGKFRPHRDSIPGP